MTTPGGRQVSILVEARNRASRVFQQVGRDARDTGRSFGFLANTSRSLSLGLRGIGIALPAIVRNLNEGPGTRTVRSWGRLNLEMQRLNTLLGAMAVTAPLAIGLIGGLIATSAASRIINYERAVRRSRLQMELMGLDAQIASKRVNFLVKTMGKESATLILESAASINAVSLASDSMLSRLAPLADEYSKLLGLDFDQVFIPMLKAFNEADPEPLKRVLGYVDGLAENMGVFQSLHEGDFAPLLTFLEEFASQNTLGTVERLSVSFQSLIDKIQGSAETLTGVAAEGAIIFMDSVTEALAISEETMKFALLGGYTYLQYFSLSMKDIDARSAQMLSGSNDPLSRMATRSPAFFAKMFGGSAKISADAFSDGFTAGVPQSLGEKAATLNASVDRSLRFSMGGLKETAVGLARRFSFNFVEEVPKQVSIAEGRTGFGSLLSGLLTRVRGFIDLSNIRVLPKSAVALGTGVGTNIRAGIVGVFASNPIDDAVVKLSPSFLDRLKTRMFSFSPITAASIDVSPTLVDDLQTKLPRPALNFDPIGFPGVDNPTGWANKLEDATSDAFAKKAELIGTNIAKTISWSAMFSLIPALISNFDTVVENPELLAVMGIGGAILGSVLGARTGFAFAAVLTGALSPGIANVMATMGTDTKVAIVAAGAGIALARRFRRGWVESLGIGAAVMTAMTSLTDDPHMEIIMGGVGALLGYSLGGKIGRPAGAIMGFMIGQELAKSFDDEGPGEVIADFLLGVVDLAIAAASVAVIAAGGIILQIGHGFDVGLDYVDSFFQYIVDKIASMPTIDIWGGLTGGDWLVEGRSVDFKGDEKYAWNRDQTMPFEDWSTDNLFSMLTGIDQGTAGDLAMGGDSSGTMSPLMTELARFLTESYGATVNQKASDRVRTGRSDYGFLGIDTVSSLNQQEESNRIDQYTTEISKLEKTMAELVAQMQGTSGVSSIGRIPLDPGDYMEPFGSPPPRSITGFNPNDIVEILKRIEDQDSDLGDILRKKDFDIETLIASLRSDLAVAVKNGVNDSDIVLDGPGNPMMSGNVNLNQVLSMIEQLNALGVAVTRMANGELIVNLDESDKDMLDKIQFLPDMLSWIGEASTRLVTNAESDYLPGGVTNMLDVMEDYLAELLGGMKSTEPRPVIVAPEDTVTIVPDAPVEIVGVTDNNIPVVNTPEAPLTTTLVPITQDAFDLYLTRYNDIGTQLHENIILTGKNSTVLVERADTSLERMDTLLERVNTLLERSDTLIKRLDTLLERINSLEDAVRNVSVNISYNTFVTQPAPSDFPDPYEFDEGGIVPGPIGVPQRAIVHGGEEIIRTHGGGDSETIRVQLILDKRVIQEIAMEGVYRTAKFKVGMVPGSIGT